MLPMQHLHHSHDAAGDDRASLEAALVGAGQGNSGALAELYRRTSGKLFGICLRILGNRSEAEDVLQEIYVGIWHKSASYDPGRASPITWLATVARNRSIDRLRSSGFRSRHHEPIDGGMDVADPSPDPAAAAELGDEAGRLGRCIEELEERQAGAIRSAFFGGYTYNELATRQGVPLGTVKSWVRRGLLRLKDCLDR